MRDFALVAVRLPPMGIVTRRTCSFPRIICSRTREGRLLRSSAERIAPVVTLCVEEICPAFPGEVERLFR